MSDERVRVKLAAFCQARSGDKADIANVAVFAPTEALFEVLREQLTAERVKEHLSPLVKGDVVRYEARNVLGLNFVCQQGIGGGGLCTLQSDTLAKTYGPNVLRMEVEVPSSLLAGVRLLLPPGREATTTRGGRQHG